MRTPHSRRKLIAGNWKMHLGPKAAQMLARSVVAELAGRGVEGGESGVQLPGGVTVGPRARGLLSTQPPQVIICPPFVSLGAVAEVMRGSAIGLGAQNLHRERQGAFTGEVSAEMLVEVGCSHVIVGHSERRQLFGETDEQVARKARAALDLGLSPIVCVGETLAEREAEATESVIERQLGVVLERLDPSGARGVIVAYEPVWAIGTGQNATPAQAVEMHAQIRRQWGAKFGASESEGLRILYGGSVKPENGASLLGEEEIDGALVGGASLKSADFGRLILQAAAAMS
jgi:triosephosphate isomerase